MAEKVGRKVKELMIREIAEKMTGSNGFVFASFNNIKASEMDSFRKKMRQAGSRYFVVKNTLGKIVLKNAGIEGLNDMLDTRTAVGVGVIKDDPAKIAKLMLDFAKANANFKVSCAYYEGNVLATARVKQLSELPSREQIIAMVLMMMNAPISGLVNVFSAQLRSLCYAINAIKGKKESGK